MCGIEKVKSVVLLYPFILNCHNEAISVTGLQFLNSGFIYKPCAYITHDASWPLSDMVVIYQITAASTRATKAFYSFAHICSSYSPKPVETI